MKKTFVPSLLAAAFGVASSSAAVTVYVPAVQDVQLIGGTASDRSEQILGTAASGLRNGIVRFDTSVFAPYLSLPGQTLTSATLTLTEQVARDGNNGSISTNVGAFFITSTENNGWRLSSNHESDANGGFWHGNSAARSGNFGGGSSGDNNVDGRNIASGGPIGSGFTTGISFEAVNFVPSTTDIVTIDMTQAGATYANILGLLNEWDTAGVDSAGMGLYSDHTDQIFFQSLGSDPSNVNDEGGTGTGTVNGALSTAPYLTLTFSIPEPSVSLLAGFGLLGLLRRRR